MSCTDWMEREEILAYGKGRANAIAISIFMKIAALDGY